ncbi:MAG: hypothetical protein ACOY4Q_04060 [Bacillota bacterium]
MGCHNQFEYRRFAAVLYEKDSRYSLSPTRRSRGYARIEAEGNKGWLLTQVKNLRPFSGKNLNGTRNRYRLRLIGERDGKMLPVNAGPLDMNRRGTGELRWDFEPHNVGGSGLTIDDFMGVEVFIQDDTSHIYGSGYPVLSGFIELLEAQTSEYPNLEKIKPFGDMPGHAWWKSYLPLDASGKTACQRNPHTNPGYIAGPVFQGHQLIGLQYDEKGGVKYLVHGVPGMFCQEDQPFRGKTGYVHWQPLPGQGYQAGNYGYWLIHIDVNTGEVVFPVDATPPPSCTECLRERDIFNTKKAPGI